MFSEIFKPLNLAVLQTGRSPENLRVEYGNYDEMCKALLGKQPDEAKTFEILDGDFPDDIDAYDLLLITGSPHGVYEAHSWIAPLEALIRKAYARNIKMLGICFGHQIIAQALGGIAVKSDKGLGLGVMDYTFSGVDGESRTVSLCAWHQDQVILPPKGAETIASSDFCPHAALRYGDTALTFQAHPEFSRNFVKDLIKLRMGTTLCKDTAQKGLASLSKDIHPHAARKVIAGFLA